MCKPPQEFTILPPDPEDDELLPSYDDVGWLEVEILSVRAGGAGPITYKYDIGDYVYDAASCVWLIDEGIGIDYFMDFYTNVKESGFYRIEGITGAYYRGFSLYEDDDEDWFFERVVKLDATPDWAKT